MTFRKDLRDAELAVIAAAEVLATGYTGMTFTITMEQVSALQVALVNLYALRSQLDADASPHSHTDTSANAAKRMVPLAGSLRRSILIELYRRRNHPTPGATCDKLERILKRPHASVSPAVTFLHQTGWIVDSGENDITQTGREAIVWVLAPGSTEWIVEAIARNQP